MNKENKEATIIKKIVDMVMPNSQKQNHESDAVVVDTPIDNVIAKERWVYLPDGLYTLEDGSNFRVAANMIVEVNEGKTPDDSSTDTSTDTVHDVVDEQSAQTPAKDETNEKFSAIESKLTNFEIALNKMQDLETKLSAIEKTVSIIGSKSSAQPAQRTDSMGENPEDKYNHYRKNFKTEKEFKQFISTLK